MQILFRFALAFLKEAEPDLLDLTDSLSIHCALRLVGQRMVNVNHVADVSRIKIYCSTLKYCSALYANVDSTSLLLSQVAFQGMNPFPMKTILHKRHIYRAQVMVSTCLTLKIAC